MNSYDYHGQENFDNPNSFEVRSYTFGEPLELVVQKLIARIDALEEAIADTGVTVSLDLFCDECPGAGNGCCLDGGIDLN